MKLKKKESFNHLSSLQEGNTCIALFWDSVTSILTQEFAQSAQG